MKLKTSETIEKIEELINNGYKLPIFKGFVAVNKRGLEKFIDTIYSSLPEDVMEARKFLKENNIEFPPITSKKNNENKSIYDYLRDLELLLDGGFYVPTQHVILHIKAIEQLLNKINSAIPEEIKKAEKYHN